MRYTWLAVVLSLTIFLSTAGAALVVPAASEWHAIPQGGGDYVDTPGDVSPTFNDIVGGLDDNSNFYASGYWASDATNIYFRIRMDEHAPAAPALCESVWQILIDSDGDDGVEWALQVDRSSSDNQVEFVAATVEGLPFSSVALSTINSWSGSLDNYAYCQTITGDGSQFQGSDDAFLNMAMPWADFTALTGITSTTDFRVALSTSANHNNINKDLPIDWSDSFSAPEPGTMALLTLGLLGLAGRLRRRKS